MSAFFRLVELTSGNVADDFDTLDEAMGDAVATHGSDAMSTYSLLEVVDDSASLVAMEGELLGLVARGEGGSSERATRTPATVTVAE